MTIQQVVSQRENLSIQGNRIFMVEIHWIQAAI